MLEVTICVRELHASISKIARATNRVASFKEYTLSDFKGLQFRGGDKHTSRDVDNIVYGSSQNKLLKKKSL